MSYCGLAHVQLIRGVGDVQMPGDCIKNPELVKGHLETLVEKCSTPHVIVLGQDHALSQ
jgi:hypothetical protein